MSNRQKANQSSFDLELCRRESSWNIALRFSLEDQLVQRLIKLSLSLLLNGGSLWYFYQIIHLVPQSELPALVQPLDQK